MYFLGIGLVLLYMKYQQVAPVAEWSWLYVLSPFGMAVAWWAWADATGYTRRKAMQREEKRRQARIEKARAAIGLDKKRR